MFVPNLHKLVAKTFDLVDSLRIIVSWSREIYSLTYSETSLVKTNSSI